MPRQSTDSFSLLLTPHLKRLYAFACRLTASRPDAEDLFQTVLTKLYEKRREVASVKDLGPWLGRVLYNQFLDDQRRYRRRPLILVGDTEADLPPEFVPESPGPSQAAERSEVLESDVMDSHTEWQSRG